MVGYVRSFAGPSSGVDCVEIIDGWRVFISCSRRLAPLAFTVWRVRPSTSQRGRRKDLRGLVRPAFRHWRMCTAILIGWTTPRASFEMNAPLPSKFQPWLPSDDRIESCYFPVARCSPTMIVSFLYRRNFLDDCSIFGLRFVAGGMSCWWYFSVVCASFLDPAPLPR